MGKGSNQTTQTTAPNASAMQAYQDLLARSSGVANTPYTPYGGELVAPVNAQQQQGIGNINANAGFASPYISQAADYATQAAQPLTGEDIARYQSPYTQQVVDATQRSFNNANQMQLQNVKGNAIAQGALGGDREAVAESVLSGQQQAAQSPIIAGLYNQGYQSAAQMAQQQQQNRANAAYSMGNLGVAGQNAALTGANAQVGAGSLMQGTQQGLDTAQLQQFLAQQAFPYQQTQWLAGINTGVGSQMGGTSTTTGPPPNPLSQILGLGATAIGAFGGAGGFSGSGSSPGYYGGSPESNPNLRPYGVGGRIPGFADGGVPYGAGALPYSGVASYVPNVSITAGRGAPGFGGGTNQNQSQAGGGGGAGSMMNMAGGLGKMFGAPSAGAGAAGAGAEGAGVLGGGELVVGEAGVEAGLAELWPLLLLRRGGRIPGFDEGGPVLAGLGTGSVMPAFDGPLRDSFADRFYSGNEPLRDNFADRFAEVGGQNSGSPSLALASGQQNVPQEPVAGFPFADRWAPVDAANDRYGAFRPPDADDPNASIPASATPTAYNAPAGVAPTVLDAGPGAPTGAGTAMDMGTPPPPSTQRRGGFGDLSPAAWQGIMAAGLGMMASRSPHLGSAIGEGGLTGLHAYAGAKQQESTEAHQRSQDARMKEQTAVAVKKLGQDAELAAKRLDLQTKQLAQGKIPPGYRVGSDGNMEAIPGGPAEAGRIPPGYRKAPDGNLEPIPGGPASTMSPHALEIGGRQLADGDMSPLKNVGRGAQGDAKINAMRNKAAEILVDEKGMSPTEAAAFLSKRIQAFHAQGIGLSAEARTAGVREANLNLILKATEAAIPAALEASEKVSRTGWVPINQIIQKGQVIASNPELREFGMANLQLAEHWARAMNPTGVMRESDRDLALHFLSTADSKETYKRAVLQLQKQITRERDAVRGERGGGTPPPGGGAAAPGGGGGDPLAQARNAISQGAPRDAVIQRLKEKGIDATGL